MLQRNPFLVDSLLIGQGGRRTISKVSPISPVWRNLKMMKRVSVQLPEEDWRFLRRIAEREKTSVSATMRRILKESYGHPTLPKRPPP